jgi:hypothetical protein
MSAIDWITYRAWPAGHGIVLAQTATSMRDPAQADDWQRRLEPWLRMGDPQGIAYLDFASEAAFIRWQTGSGPGSAWDYAHVLTSVSETLTGTYALELAETGGSGAPPGAAGVPPPDGGRRDVLEQQARSADSINALIPLLAHALQGERRVTMPSITPELSDAAVWGLLRILRMIGDDRPVSFLTYVAGPVRREHVPGLLVSFRPDVIAPLPPDSGFSELAADLAYRFADDPDDLHRTLVECGLPEAADHARQISRLLNLPPRRQAGNLDRGGKARMGPQYSDPGLSPGAAVATVTCPICLTEIRNWDELSHWRYSEGDYQEIQVPSDVSPTQRARHLHGAFVRCPAAQDDTSAFHYLPARYGRFGEPVLLGFVGLTQSGKSHLLAAMIGEISKLSAYQVTVRPLDPATHHRFVENSVKPLIARSEVLPGTPDDATTAIADAFIVRHGSGPERVVALFDVSGGVLAQTDKMREFLWIADGLFFVIDPDHIVISKAGDDTFNNVLEVVRNRARPGPVSAAIVLSKADKARFDEPVARWLRSGDGTMSPTDFLRESADIYSYLQDRHAGVLTEPYEVCEKTTLHVVSPTGGAQEGEDKYPRGVTPLRVLRPLLAMLAMTGVLTGPQTEMIGI